MYRYLREDIHWGGHGESMPASLRGTLNEISTGVATGNRTLIHGTTNHCPAIER